jgi:hypothetical protein
MEITNIIVTLLQFGEIELVTKILFTLKKTAEKAEEFALLTSFFANLNYSKEALECGKKVEEKGSPELKATINKFMYDSYRAENRPQEAIETLEAALFSQENTNNYKLEMASVLYEANQKDKALKLLDSIDVAECNDFEKVKLNALLGPHQLRNGNFKEGIKNVIISQDTMKAMQFGSKYHNKNELPLQFWEGTPDCKKLIVYLEAGLGDEIINIRFLKKLETMGIEAKLFNFWHEDPVKNNRVGMYDFYEKNGFQVIRKFVPEEYTDYQWTYSQYLPILLGLTEKEIWDGPYLKAKKKKLQGKKKIGLRWAGNPNPKYRNFPLADFYNSIKHIDATFYSLQKDECMNELADFPEIIDLSDDLDSFEKLASYIASLDLLITCPTVTCTLAGAMGVPCIMTTPISDYYVFNTKTNKTPWFGKNFTVLRQKTPRKWDDVLDQLAETTENVLKGKNA